VPRCPRRSRRAASIGDRGEMPFGISLGPRRDLRDHGSHVPRSHRATDARAARVGVADRGGNAGPRGDAEPEAGLVRSLRIDRRGRRVRFPVRPLSRIASRGRGSGRPHRRAVRSTSTLGARLQVPAGRPRGGGTWAGPRDPDEGSGLGLGGVGRRLLGPDAAAPAPATGHRSCRRDRPDRRLRTQDPTHSTPPARRGSTPRPTRSSGQGRRTGRAAMGRCQRRPPRSAGPSRR